MISITDSSDEQDPDSSSSSYAADEESNEEMGPLKDDDVSSLPDDMPAPPPPNLRELHMNSVDDDFQRHGSVQFGFRKKSKSTSPKLNVEDDRQRGPSLAIRVRSDSGKEKELVKYQEVNEDLQSQDNVNPLAFASQKKKRKKRNKENTLSLNFTAKQEKKMKKKLRKKRMARQKMMALGHISEESDEVPGPPPTNDSVPGPPPSNESIPGPPPSIPASSAVKDIPGPPVDISVPKPPAESITVPNIPGPPSSDPVSVQPGSFSSNPQPALNTESGKLPLGPIPSDKSVEAPSDVQISTESQSIQPPQNEAGMTIPNPATHYPDNQHDRGHQHDSNHPRPTPNTHSLINENRLYTNTSRPHQQHHDLSPQNDNFSHHNRKEFPPLNSNRNHPGRGGNRKQSNEPHGPGNNPWNSSNQPFHPQTVQNVNRGGPPTQPPITNTSPNQNNMGHPQSQNRSEPPNIQQNSNMNRNPNPQQYASHGQQEHYQNPGSNMQHRGNHSQKQMRSHHQPLPQNPIRPQQPSNQNGNGPSNTFIPPAPNFGNAPNRKLPPTKGLPSNEMGVKAPPSRKQRQQMRAAKKQKSKMDNPQSIWHVNENSGSMNSQVLTIESLEMVIIVTFSDFQ